ncbi:MAG TPA: ATP-dependent DNA helicase RecG [bacterium]|nr:ATP-dependent DNA helicase RecG [bacterium]HPO51385.1 ATP-dependent DNA helicase RecG [bacterium]
MLLPESSIKMIPGLGLRRAEYFYKMGITTIKDLLFHFPRKYLDRRQIKKISEVIPGETVSLKGNVMAVEEKRINRLSIVKIAISDGTGVIFLIFFNQNFILNILKPGTKVFVYGRIDIYKENLQINNPLFEILETKRKLDYILPVYSVVSGLTQNFLRKCIRYALENMQQFPPDILPLDDRSRLKLSSMKHALINIHFPENQINLERARRHLIFDEFFRLQIGLIYKKIITTGHIENIPQNKFESSSVHNFAKMLPFQTTADQTKAMKEILKDLSEGRIINRLLQGEVGSGKTVVAIFFLWLFSKDGGQGVFLAPTEILAEQHYLNWSPFFLSCGVESALLTGNLPEKMKKQVREKIEKNQIQVLFGTHALLNEKIVYPELKAIVVDEQHKFGVEQRNLLQKKSSTVHYLAMSATPIPRSVALAFYGNVDMSTIGQLPKGSRRITSYLFKNEETEKVYEFIKRQVYDEKQGYFVAPTITGSEESSVVYHFNKISQIVEPQYVALLHGKLPGHEKSKIIERFREKKIRIIVSTTVIEVGIDVPDANFIVIDEAEKFGLSQLHQMRGRVGRSGEIGYCILIHHTDDPASVSRLESFLEIEDGLKLAEIDLSLRGPGDLLGVRQHGVLPLKIGNIVTDIEILNESRNEAERILNNKLYLKEKYVRIKEYLEHCIQSKIID